MRQLFARVVMLSTAVAAVSGCAGRFSGEVDGDPVPPFSSAALATFDGGARGGLLRGIALPGNSCEEGAAIFDAARALTSRSANENQNGASFEEAAEPLIALLNESQRENDWRLDVTVLADSGLDDVDGATVDLDDFDSDVFVRLSLCRKDGEAETRDGGFNLDERVDCFFASDGDVVLERNDDEGLRLIAEQPLEFANRNGIDDGELALDIGFQTCGPLEEALNLGAATPSCFDSCIASAGGIVDCVNNCRGFEGEGEGEGEFEGEGEGEGEGEIEGEGAGEPPPDDNEGG